MVRVSQINEHDEANQFALVFISKGNLIKLGDFGLSKALPQASFAQTYVGVRIGWPVCDDIHTLNTFPDAILHVPRTYARKGL